ncbi:MAG: D-amino acid aminotransferase [Gammaproteobacteria bacterium]|nr:D-amino acid aminotransferase [Gammaproteobacteria bacterium]
MSTCYLNGKFIPLDSARVSVLDRGFIFGDGIYEVLPVYAGRPFRLEAHLCRLEQSLVAISIVDPYGRLAWIDLIYELIAANCPAETLSIYLQVTRGVAPRNHAAPLTSIPTVFMMVSELTTGLVPAQVAAIVLEDLRWQRCDIKAISLLPNVMARTAASLAGVYEAILVRDGWVTEGAASNVFIVSRGRIKTPPKSSFILSGITRDTIVEALADTTDAVQEVEISQTELLASEEVWLTSSTRDIVSVTRLDSRPVGTGEIGVVYRRVCAAYARFKVAELANTKTPLYSSS